MAASGEVNFSQKDNMSQDPYLDELAKDFKGKRFYFRYPGLVTFIGLPLLIAMLALVYAYFKPIKEIVIVRHETSIQEVAIYRYVPQGGTPNAVVDSDETEANCIYKSKQDMETKGRWQNIDDVNYDTVIVKADTGMYKVKAWATYGENMLQFWEWKSGKWHRCNGNWEIIR